MTTKPLDKYVSYHAFSPDGKACALSKDDDAVYIYDTDGSDDTTKWKQKQVVTEHGGRVSGIDWCEKTNQIVTCGHDRNAYVWKQDEKTQEWKPTLVILRINRAATCVRWSPNGDKFAVGSGAKCVPVCHFEEGQNWWISKMIKKHKSSVLDLDWSPNQKYLVTGACDFKCRIFSAFIEGIDSADSDALQDVLGMKDFGECLVEFDQAKAWVQAVSWAPNGNRIAFAGHGSTLTFVHLAAGGHNTQTIYQKCLPYAHTFFTDDDTLVAIGFEHNPTTYKMGGSDTAPEWKEDKLLDECKEEKKAAGGSAASKARNMFQSADSRGQKGKSDVEEKPILTQHKNNILGYQIRGPGKFSTSGVDGRIIQWSL